MTITNKFLLIKNILLGKEKIYSGEQVYYFIENMLNSLVHDIKKEDKERGTYRGRINDEAGVYQDDVVVIAVGDGWTYTDYSTDADGYFNLSVPADKEFKLIAYDKSDKYSAVYPGFIAGVPAGTIVEE